MGQCHWTGLVSRLLVAITSKEKNTYINQNGTDGDARTRWKRMTDDFGLKSHAV